MSKLVSTRRQFVQSLPALLSLGVLTQVSVAANAEERRRPKKADGKSGELPLVDPATDSMAKSVNYVHDHKDMNKAELKTERSGVKWDAQFCSGCTLMVAIPGKTDVVGCTLFSGKAVKAKGWCSSWAKKA